MRAGLLLAGLFLCAACDGPTVKVAEILNHPACNGLRAGMQQVEFEDLPAIRGVQLIDAASTPATPPAQALLVAVSRGSRAHPGHRFVLASAGAEGTGVRLDYAWQAADAGGAPPRKGSSPCSVVQLDWSVRITAVSAWLEDEQLGRLQLAASAQ